MKREAKKPRSRKQSASDRKASRGRSTTISGGASLKGQNIGVGGDVVGRDKLVAGDDIVVIGKGGRLVNVDLPRSVQIAIGVAAAAIVVMAVVFITRPPPPVVVNGSFEDETTNGWEIEGTVNVVETGEPSDSPVGRFTAELQDGAALEQLVNVPAGQSHLMLWYRPPPNGQARGTLNIYLNGQSIFSIANPADRWNVFETVLEEDYAGKQVRLRVEYAAAAGQAGGRLRTIALQARDAVWVDNIAITEITGTPTPEPTATPSPTAAAALTPTRVIPTGPLSLTVEDKSKACTDSTYYIIEYSLTATGGRPPYRYYRDIEAIGGPVNEGIVYPLTYGENTAATGTFIVIDSSNQRAEEKFYASPLDCP